MGTPKANFGGSAVQAPNLQGSISALNSVGSQIDNYNKMQAIQKQQAIDNARANERLGIAQSQEARAASLYQVELDKKKAIAAGANVQKNTESGTEAQARFQQGATNVVASFGGLDKFNKDSEALVAINNDKLASLAARENADIASADNDTDKAIIRRNAEIAREIIGKEYNTAVDKLRSTTTPNAARDVKMLELGTAYANTNQLSGYDGLKSTVADNTYKQRVYDNLMATGTMTPAEAMTQAKLQDSMVRTPGTSKELAKRIEGMKDELKTSEANELKIIENKSAIGKSGNGKSTGKGGTYKSTVKDAIADIGFGGGIFSAGMSPVAINTMLNEVNSDFKKAGLNPTNAQMAAALYASTEGEADKWTSLDPSASKEAFTTALRGVIRDDITSGSSGSRYSSNIYSKYGPTYEAEAKAVMNKYALARKELETKYSTSNLIGTGLDKLEGMYTTPANRGSDAAQVKVTRVPKDNIKSITKTTTSVKQPIASKPVKEDIKTQAPISYTDRIAAVKDKFKEPMTETTAEKNRRLLAKADAIKTITDERAKANRVKDEQKELKIKAEKSDISNSIDDMLKLNGNMSRSELANILNRYNDRELVASVLSEMYANSPKQQLADKANASRGNRLSNYINHR